jgi:hypothetical protein
MRLNVARPGSAEDTLYFVKESDAHSYRAGSSFNGAETHRIR